MVERGEKSERHSVGRSKCVCLSLPWREPLCKYGVHCCCSGLGLCAHQPSSAERAITVVTARPTACGLAGPSRATVCHSTHEGLLHVNSVSTRFIKSQATKLLTQFFCRVNPAVAALHLQRQVLALLLTIRSSRRDSAAGTQSGAVLP